MATATASHTPEDVFDVEAIRAQFPILSEEVHGKSLVYLDTGASAQKPQLVMDAVDDMYKHAYSNVHRGAHRMSELATDRFEHAREQVRSFLNAAHSHEIIFVRNGTEACNLVAFSYAKKFLQEGDAILISEMEHHSNIVPWHMVAEEKGLRVLAVPVTDDGGFDMDAYDRLLEDGVKLVAVTHTSNVLGTVTPAKEIIRKAHAAGAKVLLDGCQSAVHMPVDVRDLDVDFYAITGHKLYGPSGIGVLYGKEELLNAMPPYQGGGSMIKTVTLTKSTYAPLPAKFEAGTPAIAQAVGFGAALDYMRSIGLDAIRDYEEDLRAYATQKLSAVPGLKIYGTMPGKAAVISFTLDKAHSHDVSTILDRHGVAIRAGHHCAQPLMDRFGVAATARASFGMYNTRADVDRLVEAVEFVSEIFG
ncbi:MAG: cysteine desulfurase [Alphaproteobacteria bacterium]|nr:cysteine desulfurase [Alphaproteobacteria bacterium]